MYIGEVTSNITPKQKTDNKVKAGSIAGSALGIMGAVAGVYAMAKKGNPAVTLKNLTYEEKDVLLIGAGSILGGLAGGLATDKDKKNVVPKLREAGQQMVGSLVCPIGILAIANKLLDKANIKMPQVPATVKGAGFINNALNYLPKAAVTVASLVTGMEIGNKIMNKVNNKIFKEEVKHDVKPEDYLVHADDLCLATSMILKDVEAVSNITSKALPATFILAGAKTGMQKA